MWLFPFPIPTTQTSIKIATKATGPIANGVTLPRTDMLIRAANGLNPRPLEGSVLSLHNLILAQSRF